MLPSEMKAICLPSGDHVGMKPVEPADLVLIAAVRVHHEDVVRRPAPATPPPKERSNRIRLPSGDQPGGR